MSLLDPGAPDAARRLQLSWVGTIVGGVTRRALEGELPRFAQWLGLGSQARRTLLTALPLRERALLPLGALDEPGEPEDLPARLTPLCALLDDHRVADDPLWTLAGRAIACGCFGSRHLWQDLGAAGRGDVTRVLNAGFPLLAAGNVRELKWKRYLFLVLGRQLGEVDLRPPKCDRCDEFANCFGAQRPEDPAQVSARAGRATT